MEIPREATGDFAAQLHRLVVEVAAVLRGGHAFTVAGHFQGYSDTKACQEAIGASAYKQACCVSDRGQRWRMSIRLSGG